MRGTSKISNNNSLLYISRNFSNLTKVSTQVALQQQVVDLEDDPLSANVGVKMLNIISKSEQYNRNIKTGIATLNLSDGFLASAKSSLDKIKDLTTGAANASATASSRAANAIELNELLKSLVSSGNAYDGSRYIFGGQNTTTPPFTIVNGRYVAYTGDDKGINVLVDYNTTMPVNSTGTDAFGNMLTTVSSKDMNPEVSLTTDHSTKLSDLNGGQGVPKGKITISYSSYPNGLEVDLSGCDTLEDVKDAIEKATRDASRSLDPAKNGWLDGTNLDWRDMQDRYVKVTINPDHNGISLQEFDLGEPLPEPTQAEIRRGLDYSGNTGYTLGGNGLGVAAQPGATITKSGTTVHDKVDYINHPNGNSYYSPLSVSNYAGNKVAEGLGIVGTANKYDASKPDSVMDGFLHGRDVNPKLSGSTLLADLEGYNDSTYTFTNGAKPGNTVIKETTQDPNNRFNEWNLSGVSYNDNSGPNGELYARAVNIGTATNPIIQVEIYSCPIDKARSSDLVATGMYNGGGSGGTVVLEEANSSGISGTVGVVLPSSVKDATVNLQVDTGDSLQASIHVPAFVEEQNANGTSKDALNLFSGWNIRGLDKPPAKGYDENHPFSTDLDGDISVNYRYDSTSNSMIVELSRPAFDNQPAQLIATGSIYLGDGNLPVDTGTPPDVRSDFQAISGRIEFTGAPGFEGISGSVYVELPKGSIFTDGANAGVGAANATANTFPLAEDAGAGTIVLGGAMELVADLDTDPAYEMTLKADTVFKKGQIFENDVALPGGGYIRAGTPLTEDTLIPKGAKVKADTILAGTVLAAGQQIVTDGPLAAGTVIPRGSYYASGPGFPTADMGLFASQLNPVTGDYVTLPGSPATTSGYDVRATFATVEDFQRAIADAGIYVQAKISSDGKGLEFVSNLAGAYLTVSEDTDCYEQMGDVNQQLTGLNLTGLVKGENTDRAGNVYTEVVYYPPDPLHPERPIVLTSDSGEVYEIEPGYYVRVYSDPDQMDKSYENRDNTTMVAEGFVPAGKWSPTFDQAQEQSDAIAAYEAWLGTLPPGDPQAAQPFVYTPSTDPFTGVGIGTMPNLVLEERNNSGIWGTVNLDYHGDRDQAITLTKTENAKGESQYFFDYSPDDNDGITVYPGGLRPQGSHHVVMQEWDMHSIVPGVNSDYSGTFHGAITADSSSAAGVSIKLYKDSSHSSMSAKNDPAEAASNGRVTLYEVDKHGNFALDAAGNRIVTGTVALPNGADRLNDGDTDSFTVVTGGNRNYGQEREENAFSTINDIIDALHQNDEEALHDLLGTVKKDVDRIVEARGDVGARNKRMQLLSERHADDVVRFTTTLTSRVGMDDQALAKAVLNYQSATNAYQAAMQVSASIMQMSLLQYI